MTASLLAKIGGGFALAGLAAVFVPRLENTDAEVPELATLLATGVAVGALTTGALYLGLTRDLGLPQAVALYAPRAERARGADRDRTRRPARKRCLDLSPRLARARR